MTEVAVNEGVQMSLWEQAISGRAPVEAVFTQNTVLKKENKYAFLGVPFLITGVTFQVPTTEINDDGSLSDFVSLECKVAPGEYVSENARGKWIPGSTTVEAWTDAYGYRPNEDFILNDGSKGIRRQIVKMLQANGFILIGGYDAGAHDRQFDQVWSEWLSFSQFEVRENDGVTTKVPSFHVGSTGKPLLIPVVRGLRASKDPQAPTHHSDTFYLS